MVTVASLRRGDTESRLQADSLPLYLLTWAWVASSAALRGGCTHAYTFGRKAASIAARIGSSSPGHRYPYVSRVSAAVAWPRNDGLPFTERPRTSYQFGWSETGTSWSRRGHKPSSAQRVTRRPLLLLCVALGLTSFQPQATHTAHSVRESGLQRPESLQYRELQNINR